MIGSSPATVTLVATLFTGQTPSRKGGANLWNSRGNSDLQGRRRSSREPPEIEGLANTARTAVQQAGRFVADSFTAPASDKIAITGLPRHLHAIAIACTRAACPRRILPSPCQHE